MSEPCKFSPHGCIAIVPEACRCYGGSMKHKPKWRVKVYGRNSLASHTTHSTDHSKDIEVEAAMRHASRIEVTDLEKGRLLCRPELPGAEELVCV